MTGQARVIVLCGLLLCAGTLFDAARAGAQAVPPPPPPPEDSAPDPYHAQKSVEIGQFYLKKGKYDAAIDRFQLAIKYQPNLALPRKLIAEACEKKNDEQAAIEWYEKYLEVLPHAPDAEKVRRRIDSLTRKTEKQKTKRRAS